MKHTMKRLWCFALAALLCAVSCGCRVIYSDEESTVSTVYYDTVTVSD